MNGLRIIKIENGRKKGGLLIRALMGEPEFAQLGGSLDGLCVFPSSVASEPATFTLTGARHARARYLLLPKRIRHMHSAYKYAFSALTCGAIEYRNDAYIIYRLPKTLFNHEHPSK